MKTKVLYYDDINLYEFQAKVLESFKKDDNYYTLLDVTAFYPDGGGMHADKGSLNDIEVIDVIKKDGEIYHITKEEITGDVIGCIDQTNRLSMIQGHDGQHLLTAIFELDYGLKTISHHTHENYFDVILSGDTLNQEIIDATMKKANEVILRNAKMDIFFIDKSELSKYGLVDNPKYTNPVRITNIEGINDYNACGCLHFSNLGMLQSLIILGFENTSKGFKVLYTTGLPLINYFTNMNNNMNILYEMSKSNDENIIRNISNVYEKNNEITRKYNDLKHNYYELKINNIINSTDDSFIVIDDIEEAKDLKNITNIILHANREVVVYLQAHAHGIYQFVIAKNMGNDYDLNDLLNKLRADYKIKGGGKGQSVSGQSEQDLAHLIKNYL